MELDEPAQKLAVINTHKGLFPFGIASAPGKFQKIMDTVLRGIPGVNCYLDDILVTGATEEEHLRNLDQVLQRLQAYGFRLKLPKWRIIWDW